MIEVVPLSRGGTNDEGSLMRLCRSCYEKPVGLNMTFAKSLEISLQFVVAIFLLEHLALTQGVDDFVKKIPNGQCSSTMSR